MNSAPLSTASIHVNGKPLALTQPLTVAELLMQGGHAGKRVAVEVNGEVVPRSLHASTQLRAGDRVEIVVAVGGG